MFCSTFTISFAGTGEGAFPGRRGCAQSGTQYVCTMANGL